MRKLLLLIFYCTIGTMAFPQQDDLEPHPRPKNCEVENICPRNTIFLESNIRFKKLFDLNSINWDHTLICREKYLLSVCLGADFMSFRKTKCAGVPVSLNLMIGGGALMFETGIGLNYLYVYKNYDDATNQYDNKQNYLGMIGRIGLRYEKKHSIFFRAGYTPMLSLINNKIPIFAGKRFNSMFGLGVGYTF